MTYYDLVIIGSGGGSKLAPVSKLGKKVALIEKSAMGGTCLNRGCIPSKMLIHLADKMNSMRHLKDFYVDQRNPEFTFDWERYVKEVSAHVDGTSLNMEKGYKKDKTTNTAGTSPI